VANVLGSGAVVFSGLGVRCGRMNVVYFTTRLYRGVRAELLVRTAYFQFMPGIPGKQTITLRLNPNPIPIPNPKSHRYPNNRLILNATFILHSSSVPLWDSVSGSPVRWGVRSIPSPNIFGSGAVRCGVSSDRLLSTCQWYKKSYFTREKEVSP